MLEEILDYRNISKALKQVMSNKGAGGVDGMQTDELRDYLNEHWRPLKASILEGSYQPSPVRKVEIPKPTGGRRMLGIPTVIDRLLQQAISQWLSPQYEPEFSKSSYGFRPGRNARQAVTRAQEYINEGKTRIVELDLEKFFDRVNHDKLMGLLARKIKDKRVLALIGSYLRSGIMEGGVSSPRTEGTPQGSPLALRTHPQTLSLLDTLKLGEDDFNFGHIINSSIFMINEKITEFGVGRTDQSGLRLIGTGETAFRHCRAINGNVWCISDTGLSLCSAGQREQREDRHSGNLCGFYSKTVTQSDWSGKEVCYFTENHDQQSSQGGTGRVFSKDAPWPKRRDKLRYPIPMTACGSKNSHRFTISLSRSSQVSFPPQILSINL